jgi:hypothetical protein
MNAAMATRVLRLLFHNRPSSVNRKEVILIYYRLYQQCCRPVGQSSGLVIIEHKGRANVLRCSIVSSPPLCPDAAEGNGTVALFGCCAHAAVDLRMKYERKTVSVQGNSLKE